MSLWLLLACVPDNPARESTPAADSEDSGSVVPDSADSADSGVDAGDTGEAADTGDSVPPIDPPDTGELWVVEPLHFAGHVYYAGDPHAHTGFSADGSAEDAELCPTCGRFDGVFEFAQGMGLSWVALSDHTNGAQTGTYEGIAEQLAAVAAANDVAHGFLTVPAAELWFMDGEGDLGHKTLLMLGEPADLATLSLDDLQPVGTDSSEVSGCNDIWRWAERLQAKVGPLVLIPHHTAAEKPMPTRWSCASESWQPAVEVYSEHGNSLGDDYDPQWAGTHEDGTVASALDPEGYNLRMGFIAGTDSHDTLPGEVCGVDRVRDTHPYGGGLTIAVMPEGTPILPQTLLGAISTRSTYGTSGPIVAMDVSWESGGAALAGLGEEFTAPAGADLELHVRVAPPYDANVTAVEGVSPGVRFAASQMETGHWTLVFAPGTAPAWVYPVVTLDGEAIYGSSGCDDGGSSTTEFLWGSPNWIARG